MWKLRILKNRQARASATVALAASAGAPDSGVQALENSHGSSAAVSELVSSIGFVLDHVDYDGEFLYIYYQSISTKPDSFA